VDPTPLNALSFPHSNTAKHYGTRDRVHSAARLPLSVAVPASLAQVKECLDKGLPFAQSNKAGNPCTLALCQSLVLFLHALSSPVLPPNVSIRMEPGVSSRAWIMSVLALLPNANFHVFVFVISFVKRLLKQRQQQEISNSDSDTLDRFRQPADELASVFGAALTQAQPDAPLSEIQPLSPHWIVKSLIMPSLSTDFDIHNGTSRLT